MRTWVRDSLAYMDEVVCMNRVIDYSSLVMHGRIPMYWKYKYKWLGISLWCGCQCVPVLSCFIRRCVSVHVCGVAQCCVAMCCLCVQLVPSLY